MDDFIAYHGLQGRRPRGFTFGGLETHPEGIHVGTLSQARMRAGKGSVLKVLVKASRLRGISRPMPRVKDHDWSWRETARRRARRGQKILVYLNRHEGIPGERVLQLAGRRKDDLLTMPDRDFLRLAPEACDSWIILDPELIQILGTVPARHPSRRENAPGTVE